MRYTVIFKNPQYMNVEHAISESLVLEDAVVELNIIKLKYVVVIDVKFFVTNKKEYLKK
jgi:hypothetical protein